MARNGTPTVFDEGHGPLSSHDERHGGLAGALVGGVIGASVGGTRGAVVGAALGWGIGEELDD